MLGAAGVACRRPGRSPCAAAGCSRRSATRRPGGTAGRDMQGAQPVVGGVHRGGDPQCRRVGQAEHDLLAPVAEQVGLRARGALGAVVGEGAGRPVDLVGRLGRRVPLRDRRDARERRRVPVVVGDLPQEVAVPPGEEVRRRDGGPDQRAIRGAQLPDREFQVPSATTAQRARAAGCRGSMSPEAPRPVSAVAGIARAPRRSRRRGTSPDARCCAWLSWIREHLQAGPVRVEVADVQRVAVAEAGGVEPLAVVVDRHGAVDDLVLAVAVHVGDGQVVVALAREVRLPGRRRGVERPARRQLAAAPVPGDEHGAGVVAAAMTTARAARRRGRRRRPGTGRPGCRRLSPQSPRRCRAAACSRSVASAAPVAPSKTVRNSGPVSTYPACSGGRPPASPMTVPAPSTVPSAVLHATSALPSPSRS